MPAKTPAVVVAEFVPHPKAPDLVGRVWLSHDGPVVVTDRTTPGGLLLCRRASGMETGMRPAIVRAALAGEINGNEPLAHDDPRAVEARKAAGL